MKRRYRLPPPATQPVYVTGQVIELYAEDDLYPSNGAIEAVWVEPKMTILDLHAEDEQIIPRREPEREVQPVAPGDETAQSS